MRTRLLYASVALMVLMAITVVYSGTTGIISGAVTDSATGEKLAGVNVIVEGTTLTTVTDENGYYVITNVPPGDYRVTSSLVGYSDAQVRKVSVLMDVTASVDVGMNQSVAQEEEVVVTEARPMIQRDVVPTMYVVDDKQEQMVKGQPNLLYSTPGLVMTLPGIVADEGGYPHIRGGRVNQVGYLMDGIPITEPVTNGFGTNIVTVGLDKMQVFSGGYRPEYGNAISGVFNQIVKTGQTAPGTSLEMLSGAQAFTGAHPEIGGTTTNGADYYVGAYVWHSELEGQDYNEVDSSDAIGKFNYPVGSKDKLTFLHGTGSSKYQMPYIHMRTFGPDGLQAIDPERDHAHQSYLLSALSLNHTINASSFFTVRPYYFRNRWKFDGISDEGAGFWWDAASTTTGLQLDYTNQLSPKHLLKAGAVRMAANNRYWATVPYYQELYGLPEYNYTANTDTIQSGLYVQDQMRFSSKWGAEFGLRYDRMKYDKEVNEDTTESQTSPRLGLSYALDNRTNLRFSYGKMIQFVYTQAMERNYTDPFWYDIYGLGNADVRPERCTQYDIGWERQVNDDYSMQVTPFYRKFTDMLQVTTPVTPGEPPYAYDNLGDGTSAGIELMFKRRPSNNWSGWLSYTYQRARAQASNDQQEVVPGVYQYVDWDQRHTAVIVLNYTKNDWNYSIMGQYGSGLPYNLAGEDPNSQRNPSNAVVNFNVSRMVKAGWLPEGQMNLSVANVFNSHTVLDRDEADEPTARVAPRFISMSYTRRF